MTTVFEIPFGTDPHKLVRTDDPDTSHAAAERVPTARLERMVYEDVLWKGVAGATSDEVRALHPNLPYSSITARFKALLDRKLLLDSGRRRPGKSGRMQRVLVAQRVLGQ